MNIKIFFLIVFCVTGVLCFLSGVSLAENGQANKKISGVVDFGKLEGRWVRPDGGYVLELRNIKRDGSAVVSYFNPRSIKVFSAKISRQDNHIILSVELRDVNYPGSIYNLIYDEDTDRLKGTYFQAMEKRTFNIEFIRMK
ncbi:MAG: hypothetical protein JW902_17300 [Syntrophaceae bacterium]|nr:hypothetical protein [Syntrophaceae bacterium]